jgi:hypothetical protein
MYHCCWADQGNDIMVDILPVDQEPAEDQAEPEDRPILTTEMLRREREAVARLRNKPATDPIWLGLALSGGGIRSASFAMGLMQGLQGAGVMRRFDYLSTVSGGGYIGASLSYFLSRRAAGAHPPTDFWFPFGHAWQTGARGDRTFLEPQQARPQEAEDERKSRLIVSFIRQHAHYMTPTPRLGIAAMIANALRAMLFSVGLYFAIIVLALMLSFDLGNPTGWISKGLMGVWPPLADGPNSVIAFLSSFAPHCPESLGPQECNYPPPSPFLSLGFIGALVFALFMLAYSVYSALASRGTESFREGAADNFYRGFTLRVTGWLGKLLVFETACLVLATLPWAYGWAERQADGKLIGAISVAIAYVGTWREKHEAMLGKLTKLGIWSTVWPYLYAALAIYGILFLGFGVAKGLAAWATFAPMVPVYLFIAILFFGTVVNINLVSQHRMYRDRLMEAMCPNMGAVEAGKWQAATDANVLELDQLAGGADSRVPATGIAPYHLINTALIIPASKKPKYSGRGADSFVFSANWSGSDATHWAPSDKYMGGHMTLPTAMAISGAALNANAGPAGRGALRSSLVSFLVTLFGAQLGYWAPNPCYFGSQVQTTANYLRPGFMGLLGRGLNERAGFIQLSDGGHFENLGLYELVRRKMRLIVVSDGGQDPKFAFQDLGNAIERVRVDFGVSIEFAEADFNLEGVLPRPREETSSSWSVKFGLAERGFALAWIVYPDEAEAGVLIYLKATMIDGLPADLYAYKAENGDFPDQSTMDQDFTEDQFEAYRELGYQLAMQMTNTLRTEPGEWALPEPEIRRAARQLLWPPPPAATA